MKKIIIPIIIVVILLLGVGAYWYMDTSGAIGTFLSKVGMDQYRKGNHEDAIEILEMSLEMDTHFDLAILYGSLAESYGMTGDVDKCIELYKKSVDADKAYTTSMINLAATYLLIKKDPVSAEEWLNKAKEINPQDPYLRENFGHLYVYKNEPEKAIAEFEAALEDAPNPTVYAAAAEAFAMLGDYDNADKYLKQAEQSGLNEKTLDYFRAKIIKHKDQSSGGGNGDVSALKGFEMYNDGKYEEAIKTLNDAVEKGTNRYKLSEIYSVIGGCYQELGDYEDAISAHKKALDADSTLVSGYINLGAAYMQNGNLKEAEDCIKMALKIYPEDPVLHFSLGSLYIMKNEPENAIVEFTKAIELDPTLAAAYGSGAIAYAMTGDFERAEELLEQSKVLGYENTEEIQKKIDKLRE